jgi:hypothetical protein
MNLMNQTAYSLVLSDLEKNFEKKASTPLVLRMQALYTTFPPDDWYRLAENVRRFSPDVVILVARKMPRIAELLSLDFGSHSVIVSDYAIPFIYKMLEGACVAVVDDFVNVGSTVANVCKWVEAFSARYIRIFAIASKAKDEQFESPISGYQAEFVHKTNLTHNQYTALAHKVPVALGFLDKSYDIELPVIDCVYTLPFHHSTEIYSWLYNKYGNAVHKHDRSVIFDNGLSRITVDIQPDLGMNYKFRFYFDDEKQTCKIVPFTQGYKNTVSCFDSIKTDLLGQLERASEKCGLYSIETKYRVNQFFNSLDLFFSEFENYAEILTLKNERTVFSIEDAKFLFGPYFQDPKKKELLKKALETKVDGGSFFNQNGATPLNLCPFWEGVFKNKKNKEDFLHAIDEVFDENHVAYKTPFEYFVAFFSVLSKKTGSEDHKEYTINWPYPSDSVRNEPFLRLRIGPTFQDLVHIMGWLLGDKLDKSDLYSKISRLLDKTIDDGGVVPCIAEYGGVAYRIYRKGESDSQEKAVEMLKYSMEVCEKAKIANSRTRWAKILCILSYTEIGRGYFVPAALERGNVAEIVGTSLESPMEATLF